ncbi:hypothetical protein B5S29_g5688 [[Candida] boidinii]|nr:hypothetical protein B5S29_g5688 [[Candida] boidinii]GME93956.1 unnamed protein product [[Candida] boidinii]
MPQSPSQYPDLEQEQYQDHQQQQTDRQHQYLTRANSHIHNLLNIRNGNSTSSEIPITEHLSSTQTDITMKIEDFEVLEELNNNDEKYLKLRKLNSRLNLKENLDIIIHLTLLLNFLADESLLVYIIRCILQLGLSLSFPHIYNNKKEKVSIAFSMLYTIFLVNGLCVILHLFIINGNYVTETELKNFENNSIIKNFNSFFTNGGFSFIIIGEKRFDNWFLNLIYLILGDFLIFLFQSLMLCINLIDKLKFIKSTYITDNTDDDDQVSESTNINTEDGNSGNSGTTTSTTPIASDSTQAIGLGINSAGTNQNTNSAIDNDYELRDMPTTALSTTANIETYEIEQIDKEFDGSSGNILIMKIDPLKIFHKIIRMRAKEKRSIDESVRNNFLMANNGVSQSILPGSFLTNNQLINSRMANLNSLV